MDLDAATADRRRAIRELRAAVAELGDRLTAVERTAAAPATIPAPSAPGRSASHTTPRQGATLGRRQLLRRLGFAAAGAATAGVLTGRHQAGAADGQPLILGGVNVSTARTALIEGGLAISPDLDFYALGVVANAGSAPHLKLTGSVATETKAPFAGSIALNGNRAYFANGTAWRSFGGPGCAGALYLLDTPTRAYDSRTTGGILTIDTDRTISLATAIPTGASGAIINLTATAYNGIGLFAVYSASGTYPGNSTLNYSVGNATATSATTAIDTNRNIKIRCAGTNAHAIIDIIGYYL